MDLGLDRAGMTCIGQVEIDPFCRRVLAKHWSNVWRFEDVRRFTGDDFKGQRIDLIAGGFPCQDISIAGDGRGLAGDGRGLAGERSGLWFEYLRLIRELRPEYILIENVAALLGRGLGVVLGNLAALGFDAEWSVVSACAMGAPHTRERVFIVANSHEVGRRSFGFGNERFDDVCSRFSAWETAPSGNWWDVERWIGQTLETGGGIIPPAERGGMADGIPNRLERIAGCGNAVVPAVAQWIGERIMEAAR